MKNEFINEFYNDLDLIKKDSEQLKKTLLKLYENRVSGNWTSYKTLSNTCLVIMNRIERESHNSKKEMNESFLEWICFIKGEIQAIQKEMDIQLEKENTSSYRNLQVAVDNLVTIFKRFEMLNQRKNSNNINTKWINADSKDLSSFYNELTKQIKKRWDFLEGNEINDSYVELYQLLKLSFQKNMCLYSTKENRGIGKTTAILRLAQENDLLVFCDREGQVSSLNREGYKNVYWTGDIGRAKGKTNKVLLDEVSIQNVKMLENNVFDVVGGFISIY